MQTDLRLAEPLRARLGGMWRRRKMLPRRTQLPARMGAGCGKIENYENA